MRVLRLNGSDGTNHYRVIDEAVRSGKGVQGVAEIRLVGKILDKIEAIGVEVAGKRQLPDGGTEDFVVWLLKEDGGELKLEEQEYLHVKDAIEQMEWLAAASRSVAKTFDLLESAEQE